MFPKTPFGAIPKPCRRPLRSLRRNLFRKLSESATCPESHPESPSQPPLGLSFGECHVSRKSPRKPFVTPFRSPSEHAGCPESQPGSHPFETSFRTPPFGLSFRKRHVYRVPIHRTLPEAPECATSPASDTSPGSLRVRHVSRVPKPGESLRVSPKLTACPRVPKPQTTSGSPPSKPRVPRTLSPGVSPDAPECATCPEPGNHPGAAQ